MSKDSNKKQQLKEIHSNNETQNGNNISHDIFQDSQEIDCTESESIILDKRDKRILKPTQYYDEIFKTQRKDISTDGQYKDSLRQKKVSNQEKIISQNKFQQSELIDDSIKKSGLKSQILAHYKLGEDQQVFRIDIKNQKNLPLQASKNQNEPKSPHWQPIQIPQNLFDDDQEIVLNQKNDTLKSQVKQIDYKNSKQSKKVLNKDENQIKNENFLNPFTYFKALRQQVNPTPFLFNQPPQNLNYQPQNPHFPPPNMGQQQFNQNIPPIQYSQTVNCVPPFSPRSDTYWQPCPSQQQYQIYQPFYGAQLMNEMKYLRQEVKALRESINYERNERQFQLRYKRQNDKDINKFQKIVQDMKKVMNKQRQQHKKQLQEISYKFIDEISKLRESNAFLQQQNQTLRIISQSLPNKGTGNQTTRLHFRQRDIQNNDKKSSRKMRNLEEILDKKIYTTKNSQPTQSRKIRTSKQIQHKKKPQITPKRRKQSDKKSF